MSYVIDDDESAKCAKKKKNKEINVSGKLGFVEIYLFSMVQTSYRRLHANTRLSRAGFISLSIWILTGNRTTIFFFFSAFCSARFHVYDFLQRYEMPAIINDRLTL